MITITMQIELEQAQRDLADAAQATARYLDQMAAVCAAASAGLAAAAATITPPHTAAGAPPAPEPRKKRYIGQP